MNIVIDSSILLKAYFFDEEGHRKAQDLIGDYARGKVTFYAPSLIVYEIINACLVASRVARFSEEKARDLISEMLGIEIIKEDVAPLRERIFHIATRHRISAYDGSYVALAEARGMSFLTADKRLFNGLKNHFRFIKWIGIYPELG
jgi:predicted nucleic acid-binding protein